MKNLSKEAKDLLNCLRKGVKVGGNKTPEIKELLDLGLIEKDKKEKGKFVVSKKGKL